MSESWGADISGVDMTLKIVALVGEKRCVRVGMPYRDWMKASMAVQLAGEWGPSVVKQKASLWDNHAANKMRPNYFIRDFPIARCYHPKLLGLRRKTRQHTPILLSARLTSSATAKTESEQVLGGVQATYIT